MKEKGFTLIELLVVISIIGVLVAVSIFGLQGAREGSRDARRKADLELIRSGIEIYKTDCGGYPLALSSPLNGSQVSGTTCLTSQTYIAEVPEDPKSPEGVYGYTSDGITYEICASLEQGDDVVSCTASCGTGTCNYKVVSP